MKLLRDESGHVLIFAQPFGMPAKTASQEKPLRVLEEVQPATPELAAVRAATQHCRFFCRWCGATIMLPHEKLGSPFGSPYSRKIEVRAVSTVCASCQHVAGFSLFRGCYGYDTRSSLVSAQPQGDTILLDWLRCKEDTCTFPLPLFVNLYEKMTADELKELAKGWIWEDLTCNSGHQILPRSWMFDHNVVPFPTGLK